MELKLHIVCHEVPFPPVHGGLTDLYYKIKALHKAGVYITLHCFQKRLPEAEHLETLCEKVFYYPRKTLALSFRLPYIVSSRSSSALVRNLNAGNAPVLSEGIHCTYPLFIGKIAPQRTFVRLHNVEFRYYENLARLEQNFLKRKFFSREAGLLKGYETELVKAGAEYLAVSTADEQIYKRELQCEKIRFLPVFTGNNEVTALPGTGDICLYHGNLAVNENEHGALWLAHEIFSQLPYQLVIAGRQPSAKLKARLSDCKNVKLIADPSEEAMEQLIKSAQVQVLPSFNNTGVKLKVIQALFKGRHCIVNHEGANVAQLCTVATTSGTFQKEVSKLMERAFTMDDIRNRRETLSGIFNDDRNAQKLIAWLFPHYPTPDLLRS